eukprot:COSAG04_NODE_2198_length_4550_cov_171.247360_10_plen_46_part_00
MSPELSHCARSWKAFQNVKKSERSTSEAGRVCRTEAGAARVGGDA